MSIFVGGSGRCGTSIIGKLFVAHPDVVYFNEPQFITLGAGLSDFCQMEKITIEAFRAVMLQVFLPQMCSKLGHRYERRLLDSLYSPKSVSQLINETLGQTEQSEEIRVRAFIDKLFGRLVKYEDASRWAEKTPHSVKKADFLYRLYGDELRYIHIIRNPADVCASTLVQKWGPSKVKEFPDYYNPIMEDAWEAKRKIPDECYLTFSLEQLVYHPKEIIRRIFEFCEVDITEDWLVNVAIPVIDWDKAHIGRAMRDLSVTDTMFIWNRCGEWYWRWRLEE